MNYCSAASWLMVVWPCLNKSLSSSFQGIVDRSLAIVEETSEMILEKQQPYEAPVEVDTGLMKLKLQSFTPEFLVKEKSVPVTLSEDAGFSLPNIPTEEGKTIKVQV